MEPSLPCPNCGQVDDLETVNPLGIHLDKAVLWNCRCNNTRAVEISHHIPQILVRKAMAMDEMRESTGIPPFSNREMPALVARVSAGEVVRDEKTSFSHLHSDIGIPVHTIG